MTDKPQQSSEADQPGRSVPDVLAHCIQQRRTTVLFEERTVAPEIIERAVELASWAPNHHLTEPWHFYHPGRQTVQAMIELIRLNAQAARGDKVATAKAKRASCVPGWLVATCVKSENELTAREDYAATACAIQNLSLYLWSEGIGMKWSTGAVTRDPRFYKLLNVDAASETVVGLISYGYPRHLPPSRPRKSRDDILTRLP